ncbi:hypothetical protein BDZ90DRAFT_243024 [Jaminaea rosea]|uniref:Nucleoside phosphatase GDA1/CD39 n=1 Tax=Jaminaea rosea TaxID=1569628 RepID=A0A316UJY1_9BASI|nr:hypothetical protein BDZ90DRAFT_243024 [Jaminaea rosea]PWN25530.1 hypothetical protein BDZ90DRAFT_243024 [Jaminaea rosea]
MSPSPSQEWSEPGPSRPPALTTPRLRLRPRRPRPPPAVDSEWSTSRRYAILVDAGSSGSRLQVYSWKEPSVTREERLRKGKKMKVLPKVEKGTQEGSGREWQWKVEPGISSFAGHTADLGRYLEPLFAHALEVVPPHLVASTPVYVMATAGMRFLSSSDQSAIIAATCDFLTSRTPFNLQGSCSDHVQVISGHEEGLLGWIAINYLMDGFHFKPDEDAKSIDVAGGLQPSKGRSTYGFLDMGGASTQIAFEPSRKALSAAEKTSDSATDTMPGTAEEELTQVKLKLLDGTDVTHDVFVTTFLGFGTNKARERYEEALIRNSTGVSLQDPCLPTGAITSSSSHTLTGTGSFTSCLHSLSPLLDKSAPCAQPPCLFHGIHVPPIDFSLNHFIGVSEYWFSSHDVFQLGGAYDYVQFQRAAEKFCSRPWSELDAGLKNGGFSQQVDEGRLKMQCFKAAWMVTVLHDGIGLPRVIDSKGKGDGKHHADQVADKAGQKNLDDEGGVFQSVNEVDGTSVSWTLGKAVLEATKDIESVKTIDGATPPKSGRPLPPWYAPGGAIGSHLPSSLKTDRASGGAAFAFFLVALLLLGLLLACTRGHSPATARRRKALRSALCCGGLFGKGGRGGRSGAGEYSLANMEEGADDAANGVGTSNSEEGTSSSEEDALFIGERGEARRKRRSSPTSRSITSWLPVTARRWVLKATSFLPGGSRSTSKSSARRARRDRNKRRTSMLASQANANELHAANGGAGEDFTPQLSATSSVDDLVRLAHIRRAVSPALMRESRSSSPSLATMPSSIVLNAAAGQGAAISRPASRAASGRHTPVAAGSGYASPPNAGLGRSNSPAYFQHNAPAVAWTSGASTPIASALNGPLSPVGNGLLQPSGPPNSFASFSAAMRENRDRWEKRAAEKQAEQQQHRRGGSE